MLNPTASSIIGQFFYLGLNRVQASTLIKKTRYDFKTVKNYLGKLIKLKLVVEYRDLARPTYGANYTNKFFLHVKRQKLLDDIFLSGLPQYLNEKLGDTACILFGSCARGDYYSKSDIDIFIQSKKHTINVSDHEKKLHRTINLFFEERWQNLNEGMKTGLLNDGVAINGRLKL